MRPWPRLLRAPRLHEFTAKTQALTHASGSNPQRGRPGARDSSGRYTLGAHLSHTIRLLPSTLAPHPSHHDTARLVPPPPGLPALAPPPLQPHAHYPHYGTQRTTRLPRAHLLAPAQRLAKVRHAAPRAEPLGHLCHGSPGLARRAAAAQACCHRRPCLACPRPLAARLRWPQMEKKKKLKQSPRPALRLAAGKRCALLRDPHLPLATPANLYRIKTPLLRPPCT